MKTLILLAIATVVMAADDKKEVAPTLPDKLQAERWELKNTHAEMLAALERSLNSGQKQLMESMKKVEEATAAKEAEAKKFCEDAGHDLQASQQGKLSCSVLKSKALKGRKPSVTPPAPAAAEQEPKADEASN